MSKMKRIFLLIPIVFVLLGLVGYQQIHETYEISPADILIEPGNASSQIARKLTRSGVIKSDWLFKLAVRLTGKSKALKTGLYHFEGELSLWDVVKKIEAGDVMQFQVTIPEGMRTKDILFLLAEKTNTNTDQWIQAAEKLFQGRDWEGLLLPETYIYNKPVAPEKILSQMIQAQKQVIDSLGLNDKNIQRLRIVASIIEKETAVDSERPWVSAVIHNRIEKGMPLQMDPTVIYGIWKRDGSFSGNIRRKDLKTDTPWNSYTRKGLPPTPICNPGSASLRAAANPSDVPYLYFVADGTGGHAFASSLEEHQGNVRQWIKIEHDQNKKRK